MNEVIQCKYCGRGVINPNFIDVVECCCLECRDKIYEIKKELKEAYKERCKEVLE